MTSILINITSFLQENIKVLLAPLGKSVLISVLFLGLVGWKNTNPKLGIPLKMVDKEKLTLIPTKGQWFLNGKAFSGYAVSYYPNGQLLEKTGFINGKREGVSKIWYENGFLNTVVTYVANRKHTRSQNFSDTGVLIFESNFVHGQVHGVQKQWYPSGKIFKKMNIVNGQEQGMQQVWWENGKLYVNYEAKNGRIFGLKRSSLCHELRNELVQ